MRTSGKNAHLIGLLGATALAALAFPTAGLAQTALAAAEPADAPDVLPGDIVVSARKQSERLLDVPINITAMSGETLQQRGVKNLYDLMQSTPSLSYGNTGQRTANKLTLRGLGISTTGTNKASVFLDGVFIAGDFTGLSLANLDRVEVLKGPQSAIFGRTTFAGAINYVTRDPGNKTEGNASIDVASFGEVHADAYLSGPIIEDKLAGSFSMSDYEFTGPKAWKDISDGSQHGSQSSRGFIGKLVATPTNDLTFRTLVSYNKNDDGPGTSLFVNPASRNLVIAKVNPATGLASGASATYFTGTVPTFQPTYGSYNYFQGYLTDAGDRVKQWRGYVQGEYRFMGGHTLTVTGAINRQRTDSQSNGYLENRVAAGVVSNSISTSTTNDDSIEVRLASPQDQPIRYAAGGYYLNLRQIGLPGKSYTVYGTAASDTYSAGSVSYGGTRDKSVFGAVYIDPIARVTISGELRYQAETVLRQSVAYNTVSLAAFNAGTAVPIVVPSAGVNLQGTFKAWLPRVNIQYKFSPDANVYATFSKGDNPGGFNTSQYRQANQTLIKEEELFNYEIGFKARLFGSLSINAAAYLMNWKNQQTSGTYYAYCTAAGLNCFTAASGASATPFIYSITENRGKTTVKGVEVDATWRTPLPGLTLRDGLSFNDSKYDKYCSANAAALYQTSTTPPYNCIAVDGNALESISKWQNSMNVDYETPLTDHWDFFTRGDWQYQSKWYESELNLATAPAFSIFNARVGVRSDHWTFEFYGKNLSNSTHPYRLTRASDPAAGATNLVNQSIAFTPRVPRQFGIRAALKY